MCREIFRADTVEGRVREGFLFERLVWSYFLWLS
jgi:hypothetical protein